MTDDNDISRRSLARHALARVALAGAGATAVGSLAASPAQAYQGNMERALSSLFDALASLREATANKCGRRVKAMNLIKQAIEETQAGIEYADERGGGGQ